MDEAQFCNMVQDGIRKTYLQGRQSLAKEPHTTAIACAYSAAGGLHCAVGHMMTPQQQQDFGDHRGDVRDLHDTSAWGSQVELTAKQLSILCQVQMAHDAPEAQEYSTGGTSFKEWFLWGLAGTNAENYIPDDILPQIETSQHRASRIGDHVNTKYGLPDTADWIHWYIENASGELTDEEIIYAARAAHANP